MPLNIFKRKQSAKKKQKLQESQNFFKICINKTNQLFRINQKKLIREINRLINFKN